MMPAGPDTGCFSCPAGFVLSAVPAVFIRSAVPAGFVFSAVPAVFVRSAVPAGCLFQVIS